MSALKGFCPCEQCPRNQVLSAGNVRPGLPARARSAESSFRGSAETSERSADDGDDRGRLRFDQRGREPEDANTVQPNELPLAVCIRELLLGRRVIAAVDFDDEPTRGHEEIHDVRSQDVLPSNTDPELAHAEHVPKRTLAGRGPFPMFTSTSGETRKERRAVLLMHAAP